MSVATAMALADEHQREVSYCFNRKEAKDHGEKGVLVGKEPQSGDRVVLVDDVITAGTSVRESLNLLRDRCGLTPAAVVVAVDRQERGLTSSRSALQEIRDDLGIPVYAIVSLDEILTVIREGGLENIPEYTAANILEYRRQYGCS